MALSVVKRWRRSSRTEPRHGALRGDRRRLSEVWAWPLRSEGGGRGIGSLQEEARCLFNMKIRAQPF